MEFDDSELSVKPVGEAAPMTVTANTSSFDLIGQVAESGMEVRDDYVYEKNEQAIQKFEDEAKLFDPEAAQAKRSKEIAELHSNGNLHKAAQMAAQKPNYTNTALLKARREIAQLINDDPRNEKKYRRMLNRFEIEVGAKSEGRTAGFKQQESLEEKMVRQQSQIVHQTFLTLNGGSNLIFDKTTGKMRAVTNLDEMNNFIKEKSIIAQKSEAIKAERDGAIDDLKFKKDSLKYTQDVAEMELKKIHDSEYSKTLEIGIDPITVKTIKEQPQKFLHEWATNRAKFNNDPSMVIAQYEQFKTQVINDFTKNISSDNPKRELLEKQMESFFVGYDNMFDMKSLSGEYSMKTLNHQVKINNTNMNIALARVSNGKYTTTAQLDQEEKTLAQLSTTEAEYIPALEKFRVDRINMNSNIQKEMTKINPDWKETSIVYDYFNTKETVTALDNNFTKVVGERFVNNYKSVGEAYNVMLGDTLKMAEAYNNNPTEDKPLLEDVVNNLTILINTSGSVDMNSEQFRGVVKLFNSPEVDKILAINHELAEDIKETVIPEVQDDMFKRFVPAWADNTASKISNMTNIDKDVIRNNLVIEVSGTKNRPRISVNVSPELEKMFGEGVDSKAKLADVKGVMTRSSVIFSQPVNDLLTMQRRLSEKDEEFDVNAYANGITKSVHIGSEKIEKGSVGKAQAGELGSVGLTAYEAGSATTDFVGGIVDIGKSIYNVGKEASGVEDVSTNSKAGVEIIQKVINEGGQNAYYLGQLADFIKAQFKDDDNNDSKKDDK